jgi:glutamate-ammonia-ligase adenylyltransferase
VRRRVLCAPRDAQALRDEVQAMREKVRAAHRCKGGLFDVKHSAGGMMDVEFAVQFLVLAHSAVASAAARQRRQHRAAAARRGCGLLPAGVGARRPTPTASCAGRSTARAWTNSRRRCRPRRSRRTAMP